MYGISKSVSSKFGYISNPSFGTIQPALKRLEKKNLVKADKFFTEGGKPYFFYSITPEGKSFLIEKLKSKPSKNPIQLYPELLIKLTCMDILDNDERNELCKNLLSDVVRLKSLVENIMASDEYENNPYGRMVLNNVACGYSNTYDLIERLSKNVSNS